MGPPPRRPRILVEAAWQSGTIGDAAQTLGLLRMLALPLPGTELGLRPPAGAGVAATVARLFPKVEIVSGDPALAACALRLYAPAPGPAACAGLENWWKRTGKPWGVFGAAPARPSPQLVAALGGAYFVFASDTAALTTLRRAGVKRPRLAFAPEPALALKAADEAAAKVFLARHGLEPKKFLAVAPYGPPGADTARLRQVIEAWVRQTGHPVLICPTAGGAAESGPLYDPLPAAVKDRVVRRPDSWAVEEASSVYRRAVAVLSQESWSPMVAAVNDTPFL